MARLDASAAGVFVIAPTPFRDDGALALEDIPRMVEFFVRRGARGLTILGMMGEAMKLNDAEAVDVARAVLRAADDQISVIVGVPASNLAAMRALASASMDAGAAGVMVAPPPTLRTDDAILRHFEAVAEILGDTPFVLQDFPLGTGVTIAPRIIRAIIDAAPSCVMLKHEDWPGLDKLGWLRRAIETDGMRRVSILTGNGGLFLPDELRRGADGAMTGFAFPEMMRDVIAAHRADDVDRAADIFDAYLPLVRYEQQPGFGLAVRKHILFERGAIGAAAQRRPRSRLGPDDLADIGFLLARQHRRLTDLGCAP